MKSKYLSAAAALLCAAGLIACGGSGNGSIKLGVQVNGLDRAGLVLQNNGGDDLTVDGSGLFGFNTLLEPDAGFNVSIKTEPAGVDCTLTDNTGKINYYNQTQTVVTCTPDRYKLGGKAYGLKADGLVLNNGSLTVGLVHVPGATVPLDWEFATKINNGAVYGVTILQQPAGQTCTLANASGTMPMHDVANITVTCQ